MNWMVYVAFLVVLAISIPSTVKLVREVIQDIRGGEEDAKLP